eukprot:scaffold69216_cov32-Tisochrysis_lutea.AAC.4
MSARGSQRFHPVARHISSSALSAVLSSRQGMESPCRWESGPSTAVNFDCNRRKDMRTASLHADPTPQRCPSAMRDSPVLLSHTTTRGCIQRLSAAGPRLTRRSKSRSSTSDSWSGALTRSVPGGRLRWRPAASACGESDERYSEREAGGAEAQ